MNTKILKETFKQLKTFKNNNKIVSSKVALTRYVTTVTCKRTDEQKYKIGEKSEAIFKREDKFGAHNYHPLTVAIERASGTKH